MLTREGASQPSTDSPHHAIRTCLFVTAFVIAIACAGHDSDAKTEKAGVKTAGPALRQPSERELEEWIRTRATTSKALRDKIAEVNESYEIVFVPGILGSQLQIGSFTYGKDPIDARHLAFGAAQSTRATTLNQFKAQIARVFEKNVDIYGQGLNDTQSANNGRPLVEFAYDWRDDLDKLAGDLDKFLQARLPNKKFVIVAHSMGGVIAWHWKNKFNKPRKRDLVALVTLGSPLQGSCEPVRMLVEGYGPPAQSGSFEKWATHLVFGKAHPAVLTFPSVFALLPAYDERQPCLKIRRGTKTVPLDHHEPGSWLGRPGGDYQLPVEFAAQAGLDARAYAEQVTAAVKTGRAFRQAFDSEPYDDQIYLLYADTHTLSANTVVEPRGQKWLAAVSSGHEPGDGRVSRESAINFGNFDARRGAAVSLERDHGGLLADPRFSSFLRDNIKRLMSQAKNAEILAFAETQPPLRDELKSRGWVADASLKTTALNQIPAVSSAMKTHVDYNYDVLASNKANPQFSGIDFDGADRARAMMEAADTVYKSGDTRTSASLYSTVIAHDEQRVGALAFKRVGEELLKDGRASDAVTQLSLASDAANRPGATEAERQARGEISTQLGLASERAGSIKTALKAYQAAAQQGNAAAKQRVKDLETELLHRERPFEKSAPEGPGAAPAQESAISPPRTDATPAQAQEPARGQQTGPDQGIQAIRTTPPDPANSTPPPTRTNPIRLQTPELIDGRQLPDAPARQLFRDGEIIQTRPALQEPALGRQTIPDRQPARAIPTPPARLMNPSPAPKQTVPNPLRPPAPLRGRQTTGTAPPAQPLLRGGEVIEKARVTQEAVPGRSSRSSTEPVLRRPGISNRLATQEPVRQQSAPNQLTPQESPRSQQLRTNQPLR
jgi:pimeloyl-ACP methyl ester carboxylesterase